MGRHCQLFEEGSSEAQKKRALLALQRRWLTDRAIGQQNGVTRQAVHQWRERLGIPALLEKHDKRDAAIYDQYVKGRKIPDLTKLFKISVSQVYRVIKAQDALAR